MRRGMAEAGENDGLVPMDEDSIKLRMALVSGEASLEEMWKDNQQRARALRALGYTQTLDRKES